MEVELGRGKSEMFVDMEENGLVPLSHSIRSKPNTENQNKQPKNTFVLKGCDEL